MGLKNSDDQGTQFDVKVELFKNGAPVASGLGRCLMGLIRNPARDTQVGVPWDTFTPLTTAPGDVLTYRVSARIGTNEDDTKCPGHSNAVGLRLYYDATNRASHFDTTVAGVNDTWYLHSDGTQCGGTQSSGVTNRFFDHVAPIASSPKCQDSGALKFAGGNPFRLIGSWSVRIA